MLYCQHIKKHVPKKKFKKFSESVNQSIDYKHDPIGVRAPLQEAQMGKENKKIFAVWNIFLYVIL
jgi:hypothetical protein